jgi:transcriptional regulator with XRE-family HTH domain
MASINEHPVRLVRKQMGLTLTQLGEAAGIDKANISRVERRLQGASIDTYRRLGRALGVDWRTLVED